MAEGLYEKTEGATEFSKLVFDAVARASGNASESAAAVDQPIDIPEPQAPEPTEAVETAPGGDLDIKEIMARLELAAERAQLRADEEARRDQIGPPTQPQARIA